MEETPKQSAVPADDVRSAEKATLPPLDEKADMKISLDRTRNKLTFFAIVLSIISLVWTCFNQVVQNKRWRDLNEGMLTFSGEFMKLGRMINCFESAHDLGYSPDFLFENGERRLITGLGYFKNDGTIVEGSNSVSIMKDSVLAVPPFFRVDGMQLRKFYRPIITVKNVGNTRVTITKSDIYFLDIFNKKWQRYKRLDASTTLEKQDFVEVPLYVSSEPHAVVFYITMRVFITYKSIDGDIKKKGIEMNISTKEGTLSISDLQTELNRED